jgi:hypothetical protein
VQIAVAVIVALGAAVEVALGYLSPGARSFPEHVGIVLLVAGPVLLVRFLWTKGRATK